MRTARRASARVAPLARVACARGTGVLSTGGHPAASPPPRASDMRRRKAPRKPCTRSCCSSCSARCRTCCSFHTQVAARSCCAEKSSEPAATAARPWTSRPALCGGDSGAARNARPCEHRTYAPQSARDGAGRAPGGGATQPQLGCGRTFEPSNLGRSPPRHETCGAGGGSARQTGQEGSFWRLGGPGTSGNQQLSASRQAPQRPAPRAVAGGSEASCAAAGQRPECPGVVGARGSQRCRAGAAPHPDSNTRLRGSQSRTRGRRAS